MKPVPAAVHPLRAQMAADRATHQRALEISESYRQCFDTLEGFAQRATLAHKAGNTDEAAYLSRCCAAALFAMPSAADVVAA